MREAIFGDRRKEVATLARDIVLLVREDGVGLDPERRRQAEAAIERLVARFAYCRKLCWRPGESPRAKALSRSRSCEDAGKSAG